MLPFDADPVLLEARSLLSEARRVRRALAADRSRGARGPVIEAGADDLARLRARLDELLRDELAEGTAARARADAALADRAAQLREAIAVRRAEARAVRLVDEADAIGLDSAASDRQPTEAELLRAHELRTRGLRQGLPAVATPLRRDAVLEAVGVMRLLEARAQLRSGLLLTGQMRGIIAEALPSLLSGEPMLLVGETGGAKTALAEHLSRAGVGREPELVSGYGDITGAQLIGTHELRAEGGATVSAFVPGPLLRAMVEGRPLILDEVNAMPPEFLKRLNRILQLRPGDEFAVQEDAGRRVTLAHGFAIIATANEQTPHRYRGLDRLSAELINRFGANAYRVHYPDTGIGYLEFPRENALLASAAVVDAHGELPRGLDSGTIERVARAAFISQQVFSGEHGEGFGDYVSTERGIDGRPGLEESVLAPRTLVAIMQKVAGSAGAITIDRALSRFVEGVMHREDRRVLALILSGQGFRVE
ncbi:MAG: AAA family ATPase [Leucobacter sp.]